MNRIMTVREVVDSLKEAAKTAELTQELGYDIHLGQTPEQYVPVFKEMLLEIKELRRTVKRG